MGGFLKGADKVLVVGFASTGEAVVRAMTSRGADVTVVDDSTAPDVAARARARGATLIQAPSPVELRSAVEAADLVVASPGVPVDHAVFALDAPVISEIELAWRLSRRPMVAVTGTNGKTTVTTLVARMLEESGVKALAAGNIGLPLIDAITRDADVLVAEVSSFQLALTQEFRPRVATWLNFAEDHLDWHPSTDHYKDSKARIWANQSPSDTAVVNLEDPVVAEMAGSAPSRLVTFGMKRGDFTVADGVLTAQGGPIIPVREMRRAFPHDLMNALAASASAMGVGGKIEAFRSVLREFTGLPHRVELVGEAHGVRYYDDSKSTTPASVLAAVSSLDSVILIAGGRNKGLKLVALRETAEKVRSVVAIGEAAAEVAEVFEGLRPVVTAAGMREAVEAACSIAESGDAVLLSPGCTSFDWYSSYGERGDDFCRSLREVGIGRPEVNN